MLPSSMGEYSGFGMVRSANALPSSSSPSESAPNVNMFSCRCICISCCWRRGRLLWSTWVGSTWLEWPKDGAENGSDELALVTGLKTESEPPGLKMNCGCMDVERLEGRWGPYEEPPWGPRMSMPVRSKYIWLSSGNGWGVDTAEGKAELGGE